MTAPNKVNGKRIFESDGPCFVKSVAEDLTCLRSRRIPTRFKHAFGEAFPSRIFLKGPSRRPLMVCIQTDKHDGTITIEEGWKDFILANRIQPNDFLLFRRDEILTLNVRVLKPCGTERMPETQKYQATTLTAATAPTAVSDGKKRGRGRPRKDTEKV